MTLTLDVHVRVPHREPGGRDPAPAPLDLVQRFVNSYDHLSARGIAESPEALDRWIEAHGLPVGPPSTRRDLRRAHEVRETLRAVLKTNNGAPLEASLVEGLNAQTEPVRLGFRLDPSGEPSIVPRATGPSGTIARVLAACAEAADRGDWGRLKACLECGWVFYDRSKNRSGTWCTMSICGSRSKMRAYRRRRAGPRA